MKFLKIELAALIAFIICITLSTYKLDDECDGIREGLLRLHVIAASDSEYDQQIKLELRDLLLLKGKDIFSDSATKAEAAKKLSEGISLIQTEADRFLESKSYPYRATVSLGKSYFPTRVYDSFTLPAGTYDALKVTIGSGEGRNWWCVMFPALCLPAAEKGKASFDGILTKKQQEIVTGEKYEIRLWLVEKWQELESFFLYNG
ncbi:MAG: stage II sporulation protein R [Ruminococcaceae bacterium]|nr:stage II sporulation protein R [Oscillospiraceae bacterium]